MVHRSGDVPRRGDDRGCPLGSGGTKSKVWARSSEERVVSRRKVGEESAEPAGWSADRTEPVPPPSAWSGGCGETALPSVRQWADPTVCASHRPEGARVVRQSAQRAPDFLPSGSFHSPRAKLRGNWTICAPSRYVSHPFGASPADLPSAALRPSSFEITCEARGFQTQRIMPAATVSFENSSMRMMEPVMRFLRYES